MLHNKFWIVGDHSEESYMPDKFAKFCHSTGRNELCLVNDPTVADAYLLFMNASEVDSFAQYLEDETADHFGVANKPNKPLVVIWDDDTFQVYTPFEGSVRQLSSNS
jgi:hypothetical protein